MNNDNNNAKKKGQLKINYAYFHYFCINCQERMQEKKPIYTLKTKKTLILNKYS